MSPFESFRRRVREMEKAHGAGDVTLRFPDGSEQTVHFSCGNDKLKVLLASFAIAHAEGRPDPDCGASPHALKVARLIAKAESVDSDVRLWSTVAGIVRGAEEEGQRDAL
jgi:hypothetical protein